MLPSPVPFFNTHSILPFPPIIIPILAKRVSMMVVYCSICSSSSSSAHQLPPSSLESPAAPNRPLISLLDGCRNMNEFKQIHSQMIRNGLVLCPSEQRRLVSFCCTREVGNMRYARRLFDEIRKPDVILWNTMIRGYSNYSSPDSAVLMYLEMLAGGFKPDNYTFPFLLKAFTRKTAAKCGVELHAQILKFGLGSNAFVQNALIHVYSQCGQVGDARKIFDKSWKQDVIAWNIMISGYNRNKQFEESCKLFEDMEEENVKPSLVTLVSVLSACAKLKDLDFGRRVHQTIEDVGIVPNLMIGNALIDMYAGCGNMDAAFHLFENMKVRDVISWTAVVAGFANSGQVDQARVLFEQMPERDFISWTAMINGYVRVNRFKEALAIFREMQAAKVRPDEFTMVGVLTACAHLGALELGEWIRLYMDRNKIKTDVFVGNALIDMYSKCGSVGSAVEIFRKMRRRDKFTWTAMIAGLAVNGQGKEALDMFSGMLRTSTRPDEITYIGVLSACTHSGLVDSGRNFFSNMISTHGIMPTVAHYGCLVDLLGRAGQLKEALEIINNMPMKPNSIVWGALLSACRVHKNVKMAEIAVKRILELEPENDTVYVILSNIYAKCNGWEEEAHRVRKEMMERRIKKKTPGCSLIEMNGVIHEFVAGDRSHPRTNEIYSKLEEMGKELKLAGYVPDASEVFLDTVE